MGRTYQNHGFFFIISILSTLPSITFQQFLGQIENPILLNCDDSSGNYTSNSQYAANLVKTLLPSLASQAPLHLSTFYNLTVGQGSDQVFGFAQCMSATTVEICRFCTNESVATLLNSCSNTKGAFIRYFNCTLRYSAQPFLSQLDFNPSYLIGPIAQATNGALFIREKGSFMSNLSNEAAVSPARFAMGITNYTDSIKIYGLAQCTRDLSSTDCYACLVQGLSSYDDDYPISLGGNAYYPSCNIRYEIYAFPPMIGWLPPPRAILQTGGTASNDRSDEQGKDDGRSGRIIRVVLSVIVAIGVLTSVSLIVLFIISRRRSYPIRTNGRDHHGGSIEDDKLFMFSLREILAATNDFSDENNLGQGGFGRVYKGKLLDGQEIAVKRLLANSNQGITQLRNEVALLAKLQHRNLVKLLGCCLEEEEKLLIYEFVQNGSLDYFLFEPTRSLQLNWELRFKIIGGIARGLLYLHEDSRLRIIHRDLKASNILLDGEMNPKISDFGLARICDQTQGNTSRIAGTYGYMAPEYAIHGRFSIKSDVFSFGVLVLESVIGRKNSGFYESDGTIDLLTSVWKHWTEGSISELIDPSMDGYPSDEVGRCIHIGLLCVQKSAMERPTMSVVVLMLRSYSFNLPNPSPPAFMSVRSSGSPTSLLSNEMDQAPMSTNLSSQPNSSHHIYVPDSSLNEPSITYSMSPR